MLSLPAYCFAAIAATSLNVTAQVHDGYTQISNNAGLSNSSVTCIFQDSQDYMWFGTWNGLNMYDGTTTKQYRPKSASPHSISQQVIRSVAEDAEGHLWIATDFGINRMDRQKEIFSHYYIGYDKPYIYEEQLFSCCVSDEGTVAAALKGNGINIFDHSGDSFIPLSGCDSLKVNSVLFFDKDGRLWVSTSDMSIARISISGVAVTGMELIALPKDYGKPLFDGNSRIWFQSQHKEEISYIDIYKEHPKPENSRIKVRGSLNTARDIDGTLHIGLTTGCFIVENDTLSKLTGNDVSVLSIFKGSQGILWLGTDGYGVLKENYRPKFISSIRIPSTKNFPVRAILVGEDGTMLIGSKGGGLSVMDRSGYTTNFNVGPGKTYNSVLSMEMQDGRIYVGTDGDGLLFIDEIGKEPQKVDFSDFEAGKHIGSIYIIKAAIKDTLYLGTSGNGLFRVIIDEKEVKSVQNFRHSDSDPASIGSNIIYDIVDAGSYLWLATRGGGLNRFDKRSGRTERISFGSNGSAGTYSSNDVLSLLLDKSGRLWAGTSAGLYMISAAPGDVVEFLDETSGLPNTDIHAILEGKDGNIWVSTDRGISCIDGNTFSVTSWTHDDGLSDNEYSDGACFSAGGGETLYFGSVAGVDVISTEFVVRDSFMPKLNLSNVEVDNTKHYPEDNVIVTDYRSGSISLYFSLPDYVSGRKCSIAYHLKRGREREYSNIEDREWINIGESRQIIVSHLRPGRYTMFVRAVDAGKAAGNPQLYSIVVSWPKMLKPWLIFLYFCIVAAVAAVLYRMHKSRKDISEELEKEKRDNALKEEIVKAKFRFFTNIAHEFSNSITLIFGAVEQIFSIGENDGRSRKQLITIRSNADRMHRQIQELMEFSRADSGHLPVQYEKMDVKELIKYTSDNFIDIAESKKIELSLNVHDTLPMWISDRSILEKILFNLLSNAMKYTPKEGRIEISAIINEFKELVISVWNSGPGIAPDKIGLIFDRYVILDNFESKLSRGRYSRTGIGLALCKDLTELLGGKISVISKVNELTQFTVTLPQKDETDISVMPAQDTILSERHHVNVSGQSSVILVVDDIADIRELICDILSDRFDTIQAKDAESALSIMERITPALIICDMIMPGMGGIKFVKTLKDNEHSRHIPVVMLSCDSDMENRVNVINIGADMFIAKPFHPRYLRAVVERILENSGNSASGSSPMDVLIGNTGSQSASGQGLSFTDKVMEVLSKNFSDENYNQDALSYDMAMSRVQLYRKIKHELEITPGELIRRYRLRQAELMLIETEKTVQEIIYDCGFHNKAYFYREFSRLHNCSPLDYRHKHSQMR